MGYPEKNLIKLKVKNTKHFHNVMNWCHSHISSKYTILPDDFLLSTYRFEFTDAKDCMLFKLKWG
jgi:hypothetical protein